MTDYTKIAARYDAGLANLKAGRLEQALAAFVEVIGSCEPISETETDSEVIVPYQAEPAQFEEAERQLRNGKPIRLVLDYFTAAVYNAGCVHVQLEDFAEARKFLDEAMGLWPNNIAIKLQASFVLARLGEWGTATATLQEAEAIAPNDPRIVRQQIWTFNEQGELERSVKVGERGAAAHPDRRDILEELMFAHERLGNDERAAAIKAQLDA